MRLWGNILFIYTYLISCTYVYSHIQRSTDVSAFISITYQSPRRIYLISPAERQTHIRLQGRPLIRRMVYKGWLIKNGIWSWIREHFKGLWLVLYMTLRDDDQHLCGTVHTCSWILQKQSETWKQSWKLREMNEGIHTTTVKNKENLRDSTS